MSSCRGCVSWLKHVSAVNAVDDNKDSVSMNEYFLKSIAVPSPENCVDCFRVALVLSKTSAQLIVKSDELIII